MNLYNFIEGLKKIEPSQGLLKKEGFSGIHLDVINKCYNINYKNRDLNPKLIEKDDMIPYLIQNYEAQYIRFSDYSFNEEIEKVDGLTVFASSSGSFLCVNTSTGEIEEYDYEEMSLMQKCGKDTESFLNALLLILELISLRLQGLVKIVDDEINSKYYNNCVEMAGGKKYQGFYKDIIF